MKTYIYWPNGVLEIRIGGKIVYFGHSAKGHALFGKPGSGDKVEEVDDVPVR